MENIHADVRVFRVNAKFLFLSQLGYSSFGKISAQPHTIVKQICFPNGDVLF